MPSTLPGFSFRGEGWMFLGCNKMYPTIPFIKLALDGIYSNDLNKTLKKWTPRPEGQGFIFVGHNKNIIEHRKISKEKVPMPNGGPLAKDYRITEETTEIEADFLAADHPVLKQFFYPPGLRGSSYFGYGGGIIPDKTSLVIIRRNLEDKMRGFEVHFYHKGVIDPCDETTSPHDVSVLHFSYAPVVGTDRFRNDCFYPIGQRSMIGWFVKVSSETGENYLYNPSAPNAKTFGYRPFFYS